MLVTNLLSFILFFTSNSASYFGNDGYMPLISKPTNCSSSLNFSSFMFSTKLSGSLIKLFLDVVICRNSFDESLPILYAAEFCVLMTSPILTDFYVSLIMVLQKVFSEYEALNLYMIFH